MKKTLGLNKYIYSYCLSRLGMRKYRNGWLKGDCPFCGKSNKFGIHISMKRVNCFKCGGHGEPLKLIQHLEGHVTTGETIKYLTNNPDFESYHYVERPDEIQIKQVKSIGFPEGFKILTQGNSHVARAARSYVKSRKLNVEKLSQRGWGYRVSGDMGGHIIIPYQQRGQLIYWTGRLFLGNGPRYLNPTTEEIGIGKSMIWYNGDALNMYSHVHICEGAINAETLGDNAIASGGKFISKYQLNELIKSPVQRFVICFDDDAIQKAIELAYQLIDFKRVKVIIFPQGKDINDLGRKNSFKLIYKAKYLDRKQLSMLKSQYIGNKDQGNHITL